MTEYYFEGGLFDSILDDFSNEYSEDVSFVELTIGSGTGVKKLDFAFIPNLVTDWSECPAGEDTLGKIVQYVGVTDQNYTNGYFYECVSDGGNPATYSWEQVDVQPTSGMNNLTDADNQSVRQVSVNSSKIFGNNTFMLGEAQMSGTGFTPGSTYYNNNTLINEARATLNSTDRDAFESNFLANDGRVTGNGTSEMEENTILCGAGATVNDTSGLYDSLLVGGASVTLSNGSSLDCATIGGDTDASLNNSEGEYLYIDGKADLRLTNIDISNSSIFASDSNNIYLEGIGNRNIEVKGLFINGAPEIAAGSQYGTLFENVTFNNNATGEGGYNYISGINIKLSNSSFEGESGCNILSETSTQSTPLAISGVHAEGSGNISSHDVDVSYAHVEGEGTLGQSRSSHVEGKYNIGDATGTYGHIMGNGTSNARSNAHTIDWSGNAWFAGDVYVGSTSGTNKDAGSKKLVTEDAVTIKTYELSGLAAYDNTATYAVGDYVYYNNLIYKCNTAVTTAEDFDSQKWTQKTYIEYMTDMIVGSALTQNY